MTQRTSSHPGLFKTNLVIRLNIVDTRRRLVYLFYLLFYTWNVVVSELKVIFLNSFVLHQMYGSASVLRGMRAQRQTAIIMLYYIFFS